MEIVFVRSAPLNLTPAIERHVSFLRAAGFRGGLSGLELDFHPERRPVEFVTHVERLRASYRTRSQRVLMMVRWQLHQLRYLWRVDPEVIQICDVFSAVPALLVKWLRGSRLIYDVRDPAAMTLSHWGKAIATALGRLEAFALDHSDAVVMVSEPLKALLPEGTQTRTVVIPNAPQEDDFDRLRFSEDGRLRVSLAGFISHRRNLEAWCQAARAEPDVELQIYGAVYDEVSRGILARFGMEDPRGLSHRDAIARMAESDAVSIMYDPEIELNRYVAPNKFFDALMLGKPVVCSRGMLLAEEIQATGCGLVVPYGDSRALAGALATLRDAATRRRMGEAARCHWEQKYLGLPNRARADLYRVAGLLPG